MDTVTHIAVGLSVGSVTGNYIGCAVASVLPDLSLVGTRKEKPDILYKTLHSVLPVIFLLLFHSSDTAVAYLLHIVVDSICHGTDFSPRVLFPMSDRPLFKGIEEWEFFNRSWVVGMALSTAIIGVNICIGKLLQ